MTLLEVRDWSAYAMTVISLLLALVPLLRRPRPRTITRRWSLKVGGLIEMSREHREGDQS